MLIFVVLVLITSVTQAGNIGNRLLTAKSFSPISNADIAAFRWISDNTEADDTFYVNIADAGLWLNQYTGRKAFPLKMLMTRFDIIDDIRRLDELMYSDPGSPETVQLLQRFSITHVYLGGQVNLIWPPRSQPDLSLFTESPDTYTLTYQESGVSILGIDLVDIRPFIVELSNVYKLTTKEITLAWRGSFVVLEGPLTIELQLYVGQPSEQNLSSVEVIALQPKQNWSYILDEFSPHQPGDWNAIIRLVSPDQ